MAVYTAPDVRNLATGAGRLFFKPEGADDYVALGNVPSFKFSMRTSQLDHYAPVNGIRVKDYSWTTELAAEVEIEMEELTAQNFQLLMLGDITSTGFTQVLISVRNSIVGALSFQSTNETGPRWFIDLLAVTFNNDGSYDPISGNNWNRIVVKGTALAVGGDFGVMTLTYSPQPSTLIKELLTWLAPFPRTSKT